MNWISLLTGLALGIIGTGFAVWKLMPGLMLVTHESEIGIYETSDGKVYISEMNIPLMSKMFGPVVAEAMAAVAAEEEAMLKGIVNDHGRS